MFRCNHVCKKVIGYGDVKWVLRGQFISSNYKLAEAWGWAESSVRKFMRLLTDNGMIRRKTSVKWTLYECTNYCVYQSIDTSEIQPKPNAQKTRKKRTANAQRAPNNNDNNYKNINNNINTLGDKPQTTKFIPPTVDEVKAYCKERNNAVDAEKFIDHYAAANWFRGKTKIKDWKACVRTWEKNEKDKPSNTYQTRKPTQSTNFEQREYGDEYYDNFFVNTQKN